MVNFIMTVMQDLETIWVNLDEPNLMVNIHNKPMFVYRTPRLIAAVRFWFKSNFGKRTMHPKFNLTRIQTHETWVMNRIFHTSEMFVITTIAIRDSYSQNSFVRNSPWCNWNLE